MSGVGAMETLAALLPELDVWMFALVVAMARAGGFLLALPQVASNTVPRVVTAVVVVSISAAMLLAAPPAQLMQLGATSIFAVAAAALGEFLFGLVMGFVLHMAFAASRIAGEVAGVEMGLSFAAVADPISQVQTTAASALLAQLAIQLFLALGLDHVAVRALAVSVDTQPLGTGMVPADALAIFPALGSRMIEGGLNLALPIMGALFSLKIAMAMLARVAPKLQIFTLAFALAIALGLFVLDASIDPIASAMTQQLREFVDVLIRVATAQP